MKIARLILTLSFGFTMNVFPLHANAADSAVVATAGQPITITTSNWKFSPSQITVRVNQPVTLHLTSAEGVHGFTSDDLKISNVMAMPGFTKSITFTPTKTGDYKIHRTMVCGQGHADMVFVVHVIA